MSGSGRQELEALSQQLQELQGQIQQLELTKETITERQSEVDEAIDAIDTLETDSVVQVPLGGGAYVRASIEDIEEIIVEVGSDYAVELEQDDAQASLERKHDQLDERLDEVSDFIAELDSQSDEVEQRAQQLQQQLLQQQMQGMQSQDDN